MKNLRVLIFCILVILFLPCAAHAETSDKSTDVGPPKTVEEQAEEMNTQSVQDALPKSAKKILGNVSITDSGMGEKGLSSLYESVKENSFGIFKKALRSAVKILMVVLLCSIATSVMNDGSTREMVAIGGVVAISSIAVENAGSFISLGLNTLYSLSDFSKALLPVMCTAAASAGALTSASAKYAATAMFMDVLITVAVNFIVPLISVYIAACIAAAVLPRDTLGNVSKFLKWICTAAITLLMLAFTTYLQISGLIAGKADEVATKVTKSALGVLPVVGDMISNTAETLVAGAGFLRNSVGVFGFLGVAALCLTPVLTLGIHFLVYKGTAMLSEALTDKRMADLISDVGNAFGMLLGLVAAGGLMLFFSVISSMKAVNAL